MKNDSIQKELARYIENIIRPEIDELASNLRVDFHEGIRKIRDEAIGDLVARASLQAQEIIGDKVVLSVSIDRKALASIIEEDNS